MQPRQPLSERVAPAEAGAHWGTRFFARVLEHLPPSTPQVERRLLRSVYEIHRMTDAMIRHALVEDVDLDLAVIYLGVDEGGRKSAAARRAVPMPRLLVPLVKRALLERGKPEPKELLCPGAKPSGGNSGMLSFEALQVRADKAWEARGLQRITAHELRHTVPRALRDAAPITQQRYTHTLPGDLERAREAFDAFLIGRVANALVDADG